MCLANQIRSDEEKEITPPEIVEQTPAMLEDLFEDYDEMMQAMLERVVRIYTTYRRCLQRIKKTLRNCTNFNNLTNEEKQELAQRINNASDKMYRARDVILQMVNPSELADLDAQIDQEVQQEANSRSLIAQL
ncbi:uncharacterized protein LOC118433883 [Folsomia candida]|uniref:Uncharacterized protein n=1 Tax=Folsomia candida TaxID=158441 RepID=A0A226EXH9_FOLCA|nr:uncharacterized protein LOC118433883 [Folsomia candida]OXA61784.1 hypothetical protein Fcan01_00949 [Folsomia candida]